MKNNKLTLQFAGVLAVAGLLAGAAIAIPNLKTNGGESNHTNNNSLWESKTIQQSDLVSEQSSLADLNLSEGDEISLPSYAPQDSEEVVESRDSISEIWFKLKDSDDVLSLSSFYKALEDAMKAERWPQIFDKFQYVSLDDKATGFTVSAIEDANNEVTVVSVVLPKQYADRIITVIRNNKKVKIMSQGDEYYEFVEQQGSNLILAGKLQNEEVGTAGESAVVSVVDLGSMEYVDMNSSIVSEIGVRSATTTKRMVLVTKDETRVPFFLKDSSDDPDNPSRLQLYLESTVDSKAYDVVWDVDRLRFDLVPPEESEE